MQQIPYTFVTCSPNVRDPHQQAPFTPDQELAKARPPLFEANGHAFFAIKFAKPVRLASLSVANNGSAFVRVLAARAVPPMVTNVQHPDDLNHALLAPHLKTLVPLTQLLSLEELGARQKLKRSKAFRKDRFSRLIVRPGEDTFECLVLDVRPFYDMPGQQVGLNMLRVFGEVSTATADGAGGRDSGATPNGGIEKKKKKKRGPFTSVASACKRARIASEQVYESTSMADAAAVSNDSSYGRSVAEAAKCSGHSAPCVKRTVRNKAHPDFGKSFWQCSMGEQACGFRQQAAE